MKYVLLFKLLCLLLTITNQQDKFEVLGGSVVVLAGENATLPCHLKPNISAVKVKVDWTKVISSDNISTIHVYENQKDLEPERTYQGRTSLFREELQKGNISLKLTQAKLSDRGLYRCGVQTANWYEEAEVKVSVKGDGSLPVVSIGNPSGWGLEVSCKSTGWHPEPELVWLDSEGKVLPAEHIETSRGQDGLYHIKGLVVAQTNSNQITCRIQQQLIDHMLQTKIGISNDLFPKSIDSFFVWVVIGALFPIVAAVVIIILLSVCKKRRTQKKDRSWARSSQNATNIGFPKRYRNEDETADSKNGKDVNLGFMQFAKSHIIQNENLNKQLDLLNTRKLDYSDVVKYHRTINLDADNAHVDLEVHDKHVQNIGKPPQSSEPNSMERGDAHAPLKGPQSPVESTSNNHKRFKKAPCVLAKEGFSSGSTYFIVEVPENGWIVGVAKASINKEKTTACTVQEGCWTLRHGHGKTSVHDGIMMSLTTRKAKKVGVFVNYVESFVSFYNVIDHDDTNKSADHIYTYTKCTFESGNGQKEKVYPFFGIGTLKSQIIIVDPVNPIQPDHSNMGNTLIAFLRTRENFD